jgi:hypothetical protein
VCRAHWYLAVIYHPHLLLQEDVEVELDVSSSDTSLILSDETVASRTRTSWNKPAKEPSKTHEYSMLFK